MHTCAGHSCHLCTQVGVKDYGAFVDVGAQTDGLLHISKLSVR